MGKTVKDKVIAVLYGAENHMSLTQEDIDFVLHNLPSEINKANGESLKVDCSMIKYNHAETSFDAAIFMDKAAKKRLLRMLEDIRDDDSVKNRSAAVEEALKQMNPQELAYLVDSGIEAVLKQQAMGPLIAMIKDKLKNGEDPSTLKFGEDGPKPENPSPEDLFGD